MDERVVVSILMAGVDTNGELVPERSEYEWYEFPNVVAARRWARSRIRAGKTDYGYARVHQQEQDVYGDWVDAEEPETILC
jgi:hypothetical protein